ncbi:MAG TPA: hypothetical protein VN773_06060 [Verrucomicrobiae bacterium]|jgi:hypothetical protein|nr:hypothetical protein [Verrucomicrobiae bacterium]
MATLDTADRDRLGGPSFVWIGKHGERLRRNRAGRHVPQVLGRLNLTDLNRRLRGVVATRMFVEARTASVSRR